jgi:hypothetical protein
MGKNKFVALDEHGRIILKRILEKSGINGRTGLACLKTVQKADLM